MKYLMDRILLVKKFDWRRISLSYFFFLARDPLVTFAYSLSLIAISLIVIFWHKFLFLNDFIFSPFFGSIVYSLFTRFVKSIPKLFKVLPPEETADKTTRPNGNQPSTAATEENSKEKIVLKQNNIPKPVLTKIPKPVPPKIPKPVSNGKNITRDPVVLPYTGIKVPKCVSITVEKVNRHKKPSAYQMSVAKQFVNTNFKRRFKPQLPSDLDRMALLRSVANKSKEDIELIASSMSLNKSSSSESKISSVKAPEPAKSSRSSVKAPEPAKSSRSSVKAPEPAKSPKMPVLVKRAYTKISRNIPLTRPEKVALKKFSTAAEDFDFESEEEFKAWIDKAPSQQKYLPWAGPVNPRWAGVKEPENTWKLYKDLSDWQDDKDVLKEKKPVRVYSTPHGLTRPAVEVPKEAPNPKPVRRMQGELFLIDPDPKWVPDNFDREARLAHHFVKLPDPEDKEKPDWDGTILPGQPLPPRTLTAEEYWLEKRNFDSTKNPYIADHPSNLNKELWDIYSRPWRPWSGARMPKFSPREYDEKSTIEELMEAYRNLPHTPESRKFINDDMEWLTADLENSDRLRRIVKDGTRRYIEAKRGGKPMIVIKDEYSPFPYIDSHAKKKKPKRTKPRFTKRIALRYFSRPSSHRTAKLKRYKLFIDRYRPVSRFTSTLPWYHFGHPMHISHRRSFKPAYYDRAFGKDKPLSWLELRRMQVEKMATADKKMHGLPHYYTAEHIANREKRRCGKFFTSTAVRDSAWLASKVKQHKLYRRPGKRYITDFRKFRRKSAWNLWNASGLKPIDIPQPNYELHGYMRSNKHFKVYKRFYKQHRGALVRGHDYTPPVLWKPKPKRGFFRWLFGMEAKPIPKPSSDDDEKKKIPFMWKVVFYYRWLFGIKPKPNPNADSSAPTSPNNPSDSTSSTNNNDPKSKNEKGSADGAGSIKTNSPDFVDRVFALGPRPKPKKKPDHPDAVDREEFYADPANQNLDLFAPRPPFKKKDPNAPEVLPEFFPNPYLWWQKTILDQLVMGDDLRGMWNMWIYEWKRRLGIEKPPKPLPIPEVYQKILSYPAARDDAFMYDPKYAVWAAKLNALRKVNKNNLQKIWHYHQLKRQIDYFTWYRDIVVAERKVLEKLYNQHKPLLKTFLYSYIPKEEWYLMEKLDPEIEAVIKHLHALKEALKVYGHFRVAVKKNKKKRDDNDEPRNPPFDSFGDMGALVMCLIVLLHNVFGILANNPEIYAHFIFLLNDLNVALSDFWINCFGAKAVQALIVPLITISNERKKSNSKVNGIGRRKIFNPLNNNNTVAALTSGSEWSYSVVSQNPDKKVKYLSHYYSTTELSDSESALPNVSPSKNKKYKSINEIEIKLRKEFSKIDARQELSRRAGALKTSKRCKLPTVKTGNFRHFSTTRENFSFLDGKSFQKPTCTKCIFFSYPVRFFSTVARPKQVAALPTKNTFISASKKRRLRHKGKDDYFNFVIAQHEKRQKKKRLLNKKKKKARVKKKSTSPVFRICAAKFSYLPNSKYRRASSSGRFRVLQFSAAAKRSKNYLKTKGIKLTRAEVSAFLARSYRRDKKKIKGFFSRTVRRVINELKNPLVDQHGRPARKRLFSTKFRPLGYPRRLTIFREQRIIRSLSELRFARSEKTAWIKEVSKLWFKYKTLRNRAARRFSFSNGARQFALKILRSTLFEFSREFCAQDSLVAHLKKNLKLDLERRRLWVDVCGTSKNKKRYKKLNLLTGFVDEAYLARAHRGGAFINPSSLIPDLNFMNLASRSAGGALKKKESRADVFLPSVVKTKKKWAALETRALFEIRRVNSTFEPELSKFISDKPFTRSASRRKGNFNNWRIGIFNPIRQIQKRDYFSASLPLYTGKKPFLKNAIPSLSTIEKKYPNWVPAKRRRRRGGAKKKMVGEKNFSLAQNWKNKVPNFKWKMHLKKKKLAASALVAQVALSPSRFLLPTFKITSSKKKDILKKKIVDSLFSVKKSSVWPGGWSRTLRVNLKSSPAGKVFKSRLLFYTRRGPFYNIPMPNYQMLHVLKDDWARAGLLPFNKKLILPRKKKLSNIRHSLTWNKSPSKLINHLKWIIIFDGVKKVESGWPIHNNLSKPSLFFRNEIKNKLSGRQVLNWLVFSKKIISEEKSRMSRAVGAFTYPRRRIWRKVRRLEILRSIKFLAHLLIQDKDLKNALFESLYYFNYTFRKRSSLNKTNQLNFRAEIARGGGLEHYLLLIGRGRGFRLNFAERTFIHSLRLATKILRSKTIVFSNINDFNILIGNMLKITSTAGWAPSMRIFVRNTIKILYKRFAALCKYTSLRRPGSLKWRRKRAYVYKSKVKFLRMGDIGKRHPVELMRLLNSSPKVSVLSGALRLLDAFSKNQLKSLNANYIFTNIRINKPKRSQKFVKLIWNISNPNVFNSLLNRTKASFFSSLKITKSNTYLKPAAAASFPEFKTTGDVLMINKFRSKARIRENFSRWKNMKAFFKYIKFKLSRKRRFFPLFIAEEKKIPFFGSPLGAKKLNRTNTVKYNQFPSLEAAAGVAFIKHLETRGWHEFLKKGHDMIWFRDYYFKYLKKNMKFFFKRSKAFKKPYHHLLRGKLKRRFLFIKARNKKKISFFRQAARARLNKLLALKKQNLRRRLSLKNQTLPRRRALARNVSSTLSKATLESSKIIHNPRAQFFSGLREKRAEFVEENLLTKKLEKAARLGETSGLTSLFWKRLFFRKGYEYADIDNEYLKEFVKQKKIVNKIIAFRRKGYSLHDHQPSKYSFMYLRADPIFRSFILDKFINVFMKSGKKKKIRNLLYRLFDTGRGAMTPNLFYKLVFDLKPSHLNVLARRGRIIYRAPIQASKTKGIMKAIKFFKTAVLAKKGEYSYYEKFEAEFFNHIYWAGYKNTYHQSYIELSRRNKHLKHFRSKTIY